MKLKTYKLKATIPIEVCGHATTKKEALKETRRFLTDVLKQNELTTKDFKLEFIK